MPAIVYTISVLINRITAMICITLTISIGIDRRIRLPDLIGISAILTGLPRTGVVGIQIDLRIQIPVGVDIYVGLAVSIGVDVHIRNPITVYINIYQIQTDAYILFATMIIVLIHAQVFHCDLHIIVEIGNFPLQQIQINRCGTAIVLGGVLYIMFFKSDGVADFHSVDIYLNSSLRCCTVNALILCRRNCDFQMQRITRLDVLFLVKLYRNLSICRSDFCIVICCSMSPIRILKNRLTCILCGRNDQLILAHIRPFAQVIILGIGIRLHCSLIQQMRYNAHLICICKSFTRRVRNRNPAIGKDILDKVFRYLFTKGQTIITLFNQARANQVGIDRKAVVLLQKGGIRPHILDIE